MDRLCDAGECINVARKGGYCWTHLKRRQRQSAVAGKAVQRKHVTPQQLLTEAAHSFSDCDTEDDDAYARAWDRLRKAASRYTRAEKHANQHSTPAPETQESSSTASNLSASNTNMSRSSLAADTLAAEPGTESVSSPSAFRSATPAIQSLTATSSWSTDGGDACDAPAVCCAGSK